MPSKLPNGKKQINVLIDEELYKQIIAVAPHIYGKVKGAISYIVEEALKLYLGELHTQNAHKVNPKGSVYSVWTQVKEEIKRLLKVKITPHTVPERVLRRAIINVRGSDPRTIKKWIETFQESGIIKYIDGFYPNRVFEIVA